MADRTLNTKIALLYKTYAQWNEIKDTYVLLKGEVGFCEVPASSGAVANEPCILFKVGDGTKTFAQLPWSSGLAADVYAWAKKENLTFSDLNSDFLAALDARIAEKSENVEYQMVGENGVWKLQKREIGAETWTDVSTVDVAAYVAPLIQAEKERAEGAEGTLTTNLAAEVARAQAVEATKTTQELTNENGKAQILNEADGGGIFFVKNDGTSKSFIGVNDSTAGGPDAQIYAINPADGNNGAKLDVTKEGIYYTVGKEPYASRIVDDNLLVVKKDIKDLAGGMHFIGAVTQASGETIEAAIERVYTEAGKTYADRKAGDLVIIKTTDSDREFICDSNKDWVELGDQGVYATKAALAAEESARTSADATLQSNIDAEETRATAAEATKTDKEVVGTNGTAYIFNESDGGGAKFENNSGIESFVGVNDGGTDSDGLAAQIYADKYVDGKWQGAKLDVTNNGMYYTVGNKSFAERAVAANEVATKGNISDEATARQAADATLQSNIDAEATARAAADTALDAAKLNKLPNVDDPTDPGYGYPYHIPYDIGVTAGTDKIDLSVKTITLDNNLTKMSFAKELPGATQSTAGLMNSTDKAKLDHFYARDLTQEDGDVLILNCNL